MSPAASLLLIGSLVTAAVLWIIYEIRHAAPDPACCYPTHADALALKWAQIAEDFAPDEFELLRRIDRQMAATEERVLDEWADLPYDHEREGL